MAGVNKVRIGDNDVYEATVVINGGQLVIPATGATNPGVQGIAVAGAGAKNVLGVAARRAEPVADQDLTGTDGDGYPVTYPNPVSELTTVYKNAIVPVTYTATACAYGDLLVAGAAGAVTKYTSGTTTFDQVVGECRAVGGIGSGGGTGLALIY